MSRELFRHRLSRVQVHPNDLKWMPIWLDEYARPQNAAAGQELVVNADSVLAFLRGLRDRGAPAWRRLQAVRAIEWYQALVLKRSDVDFAPFKQKLGELAEAEKRAGVESTRQRSFIARMFRMDAAEFICPLHCTESILTRTGNWVGSTCFRRGGYQGIRGAASGGGIMYTKVRSPEQ